jgi:hypothetical protein
MDPTNPDPQHGSNQCFGAESTFLAFKFSLSFTDWLVNCENLQVFRLFNVSKRIRIRLFIPLDADLYLYPAAGYK